MKDAIYPLIEKKVNWAFQDNEQKDTTTLDRKVAKLRTKVRMFFLFFAYLYFFAKVCQDVNDCRRRRIFLH